MLTYKVDVSRYVPGDEQRLLTRGLRRADVLEAVRVAGLPADTALRLTVANADMAASISINGNIVALLGVGRRGTLSNVGVPWIVGHDDFEYPATAPAMVRISRRFVEHWLTVFDRLENVGDPEHVRSIPYLEWLGFTLDWDNPIHGPFGHPLIKFWRNKACA